MSILFFCLCCYCCRCSLFIRWFVGSSLVFLDGKCEIMFFFFQSSARRQLNEQTTVLAVDKRTFVNTGPIVIGSTTVNGIHQILYRRAHICSRNYSICRFIFQCLNGFRCFTITTLEIIIQLRDNPFFLLSVSACRVCIVHAWCARLLPVFCICIFCHWFTINWKNLRVTRMWCDPFMTRIWLSVNVLLSDFIFHASRIRMSCCFRLFWYEYAVFGHSKGQRGWSSCFTSYYTPQIPIVNSKHTLNLMPEAKGIHLNLLQNFMFSLVVQNKVLFCQKKTIRPENFGTQNLLQLHETSNVQRIFSYLWFVYWIMNIKSLSCISIELDYFPEMALLANSIMRNFHRAFGCNSATVKLFLLRFVQQCKRIHLTQK